MATYWEIAAHSAYDMFSWYKYLFVNLAFSHLGFWSGNLFLIVPFPDLCLHVLFLSTCFYMTRRAGTVLEYSKTDRFLAKFVSTW